MQQTTVENLHIEIYENRRELGIAAAAQAAEKIRQLLDEKEFVNIIFAAAASQNEFLDALVVAEDIDWGRVNAFHMDEYIGLPNNHPQRFGNYLRRRFFDKVKFHSLELLNETGLSEKEEIARYSALLSRNAPDITFMGIGENTHLAFNDPHVADFNDPALVKVVDIDQPCKQQQVREGCFPTLDDVPSYAFTLTIPMLMRTRYIFCMVPGSAKAWAVNQTLTSEITELYPATSLRKHPAATLYLDKESAAEYLHDEIAV